MQIMHDIVKKAKTKTEIGRKEILAQARKEIAATTDVRKLGEIERKLSALQQAVKKVNEDRDEMNDIGNALVEAAIKGGRILIEMAKTGERHSQHKGPGRPTKNNAIHNERHSKSLADLGFNYARAHRWRVAAQLPDNLREQLIDAILDMPDEVITLLKVVKAGKLYLGKKDQRQRIVPSDAAIKCESWERWLPKQEPCDVLLTDPPYSTDIEDIAAFAKKWLPVALGKVKMTGRAYVCIGAYPKELQAYLSVKVPRHLLLSQVLVWTYRNRVGPSPTHDYKLNWQAILYYRGTEAPELNCSRAVNDYPNLTEQFSVQDINLPDPRRHESWHSWQKPNELCERFVRHASQPADVILDPFAGTGSFILAAAKLGRLGLGCDVNKDMVKIAKQRGCHG
jgi:DNA methylase